ncbi:hypothetical protein ACFVMC_26660 [Nocardia sp. NPDC127579]|uniref:hypothetical protein n=1 Tax=Nocardia sp. NPDC127579 TaxID=3345402 RepID=UPI0036317B61
MSRIRQQPNDDHPSRKPHRQQLALFPVGDITDPPGVVGSPSAAEQRDGAYLPSQTKTLPMPVDEHPQIEGLDR